MTVISYLGAGDDACCCAYVSTNDRANQDWFQAIDVHTIWYAKVIAPSGGVGARRCVSVAGLPISASETFSSVCTISISLSQFQHAS